MVDSRGVIGCQTPPTPLACRFLKMSENEEKTIQEDLDVLSRDPTQEQWSEIYARRYIESNDQVMEALLKSEAIVLGDLRSITLLSDKNKVRLCNNPCMILFAADWSEEMSKFSSNFLNANARNVLHWIGDRATGLTERKLKSSIHLSLCMAFFGRVCDARELESAEEFQLIRNWMWSFLRESTKGEAIIDRYDGSISFALLAAAGKTTGYKDSFESHVVAARWLKSIADHLNIQGVDHPVLVVIR